MAKRFRAAVIGGSGYGGAEMISYPMHIFPLELRRFFTYVVPLGCVSYFPALAILGVDVGGTKHQLKLVVQDNKSDPTVVTSSGSPLQSTRSAD